VLGEVGTEALTIDLLVTRMGVTKGSFYHHFQNYQDFKDKLLAFFEHEGTLDVIAIAEQSPSPLEKLERLLEITLHFSPNVELAIRAWALQDTQVRACQERIDSRRIAYLQELIHALGSDDTQSLVMARLLYAIYIGSLQIKPPLQGAALEQLYYEFMRLYGLARKHTQRERDL